jgi:hypothetical protein
LFAGWRRHRRAGPRRLPTSRTLRPARLVVTFFTRAVPAFGAKLLTMNSGAMARNSRASIHRFQEPSMNASMLTRQIPAEAATYELRYSSLLEQDRVFAFPCDELGHVDIDTLDTHTRLNYFYARTVIGREFARPVVAPVTLH